MRVIFDIVHPADVLFFLHPMRIMAARGDQLLVLSRHKDVTVGLLDGFWIAHRPVSAAGAGTLGLARELVARNLAVLKAAWQFRPEVMIGVGGVAIAHVGTVLRIPSVSFYYADTAHLQTRITWPFISHLYVPEPYRGPVPAGRTTRFGGVKELSYFHRDNFMPDRETALRNGLAPDRRNFFVRVVQWRANHDLGKTGWTEETLRGVVALLAAQGKVHLSSERQLPDDLKGYAYAGSPTELHHVLAGCSLYVGESATMAHEAALLGVPAIYAGHDQPGTTRELAREGLLVALEQANLPALAAACSELLTQDAGAATARRDAYLRGRPNLAHYIVAAADRHARRRP
jgi:predicted glycosyltransferase